MNKVRQYGGWILGDRLGSGGNGLVFAARRGAKVGAIKVLRKGEAPRRQRFTDEVSAMRRCADIPGVLPILDSSELHGNTDGVPWFVMARAVPIQRALSKHPSLRQVVEAIEQIATTLAAMHARGVSHRDVKPENLFLHETRWSLGDFGLAAFAGKVHHTEAGERIGPIYYIAPEMLNSAATSNGMPADVFSLAKTLWVLATGQRFPLPGQYFPTQDVFRIGSYVMEEGSSSLDALVAACTAVDPNSRPTMQQFRDELDAWLAPRPQPVSPVALDISEFKAQLQTRSADVKAQREREREHDGLAQRSGLRLRERLRPLAQDVEASLKSVGFESVGVTLDNFQWGLDIGALVPSVSNDRGVRLSLAIHASSVFPEIFLNCRYIIQITGDSPTGVLAWHKELKYMPEGPREDIVLADLDRTVRDQLQMVVRSALELGLGSIPVNVADPPRSVLVRDTDGRPIERAVVFLIARNGLFRREVTNQIGEAAFAGFPFSPVTAFVTHERYPALIEDLKVSASEVTLKSSDNVLGSFVATAGWTSVPNFDGDLSFIRDASDRLYVYGNNVAINEGLVQPVDVALGTSLSLYSRNGAQVTILPRAFCGSCFVLDVEKSQSVASADPK
jgi:serine/threonine protein kinase